MNDYSALAQRVSMMITGVRGCLLLSRDGMVLGAHPEGESETHLRSAWVRFAAVGDPERSYVEFPDQVWAFVRRGGYSAFAVADAGVRPGILIDLLEQALMAGEQERARDRETTRLPEAPSAPSGKPRISMHKPERAPEPERAFLAPVPAEASSPEPTDISVSHGATSDARIPMGDPPPAIGDPRPPIGDRPAVGEPRRALGESRPADTDPRPAIGDLRPPVAGPVPVPQPDEPKSEPRETTEELAGGVQEPAPEQRPERREEETEVDRILLAKEFAGLLQVPKEDDEGSR